MFITHSRNTRSGAAWLLVVIVLACTACVRRESDAALRLLPVSPGVPAAVRAPWWHNSGDMLLDRLTSDALADDAIPACEARPASTGHRLLRVFDHPHARIDRSETVARAWDTVALRLARAQEIGLAYLRVRGWQARLAQRLASPDMLRDNAQIARFRREAGLVPALDEDMAAIMLGLNGADVDTARARLDEAIAQLAQMTGKEPLDLRALLDGAPYAGLTSPPDQDDPDVSARPDLHALEARLVASPPLLHMGSDAVHRQLEQADDGQGTEWAIRWTQAIARARHQAQAARAELATMRDQVGQRQALASAADKVLMNARLAYRNGAAGFAALYAAEAAGMATREGRIDADDAVGAATLRLWTAQGLGEAVVEGACDRR